MKQKHKVFCLTYVKNGGKVVPAMVAAGYSARSAASQGSRLLKNVEIRAELDRLTSSVAPECLVDHKFVLSRLREVCERCMEAVPVMEFNREDMEYRQVTETLKDPATGETKEVGVYKFDASGANKSLELMGRHLKMFVDRVETTNPGDLATDIAEARKRTEKALKDNADKPNDETGK